ncbi:hypothetical protein [Anoxybacillus sp. ST4]|nr:hypothetical protein [Anoxybacillus sp. ST4]MBW7652323.1 hypothetical protein [Anoxybacillus sp. ST4]
MNEYSLQTVEKRFCQGQNRFSFVNMLKENYEEGEVEVCTVLSPSQN